MKEKKTNKRKFGLIKFNFYSKKQINNATKNKLSPIKVNFNKKESLLYLSIPKNKDSLNSQAVKVYGEYVVNGKKILFGRVIEKTNYFFISFLLRENKDIETFFSKGEFLTKNNIVNSNKKTSPIDILAADKQEEELTSNLLDTQLVLEREHQPINLEEFLSISFIVTNDKDKKVNNGVVEVLKTSATNNIVEASYLIEETLEFDKKFLSVSFDVTNDASLLKENSSMVGDNALEEENIFEDEDSFDGNNYEVNYFDDEEDEYDDESDFIDEEDEYDDEEFIDEEYDNNIIEDENKISNENKYLFEENSSTIEKIISNDELEEDNYLDAITVENSRDIIENEGLVDLVDEEKQNESQKVLTSNDNINDTNNTSKTNQLRNDDFFDEETSEFTKEELFDFFNKIKEEEIVPTILEDDFDDSEFFLEEDKLINQIYHENNKTSSEEEILLDNKDKFEDDYMYMDKYIRNEIEKQKQHDFEKKVIDNVYH